MIPQGASNYWLRTKERESIKSSNTQHKLTMKIFSTIQANLHRGVLPALITASAFAMACDANAQVTVPSTVTFGMGIYDYSFSVMNNGSMFDLAIVNIPVGAGANPFGFLAPTGFGISFDPGPSIVSFFEDADLLTPQTFAPGSTVGMFSFSSSVAPAAVTFEALDAVGNSFTGTTQSPVPEPAAFTFLGVAVLGLLTRRNRRMLSLNHAN